MREGWELAKLGKLCEVIAGQSPEGKFYNEGGDGVPFYQGKKEFQDKYIGPPKIWTRKVTKEAEAGDVLMSVRAPVGPVNFATEKSCIGRGLAAIRASNRLDRDFLFYFLLSKESEISGSEGAVFASINKAQIEEIEFPLPSLPEQKHIVAILDEAFEGIGVAVANAETNFANARELFESYLQSVFDTKGEQAPLSELATDITDGDHSPPPKAASGVPFITISDIVKRTRTINFSNTFFVPQEYFQNLKPNKKPRPGDVLYTVTGATLGIPVLVKQEIDFCFQRHIGLIRPKPETDSVWLSYALVSPQVFAQATVGSTGAAQKTVSLAVLRSITVPKIRFSEQRAIAAKLDALTAETQHLESLYQSKLAALAELKQSVLQKAFAGELTAQPEQFLQEAVA